MTNKFKQQVEARGVKKLDSLKGVETLSVQELREIEGGFSFNLFGIVEHDPSRDKGHRWKWFWQNEW